MSELDKQSIISSKSTSKSPQKNFRSINQFRYTIPGIISGNPKRIPIRPIINFLLIIFTTLQVVLLISSRIYLRGQLARTFLSVYVDKDNFPQVFDGKQFYINIQTVKQLMDHFTYLFDKVNGADTDGFVDFCYKNATFSLNVVYKSFTKNKYSKTIYPINPKIGIIDPFDMSNITDIQLFLLQVQQFQIQITNLTMNEHWQGFSERYDHIISYQYVNSIKIQLNFYFKISNAMGNMKIVLNNKQNTLTQLSKCANGECYYKSKQKVEQNENLTQFTYTTRYIIKLRTFYIVVFILAVISLYFNFQTVKKTYKILFEELQYSQRKSVDVDQQLSQNDKQQQEQLRNQVKIWVNVNKITITSLKFQHYLHILEFDTVFSMLSNIFQIIAAFYLVSGNQKQRLAGLTCMFSWFTTFKFIRSYKKLSLMYELLKASFFKVMIFFIQFLPVFLSYALLGTCLFPKVSFFASLADSVTTLVSLMMGDSICLVTSSISQKNSTLLTILYIFSFVLLFMHAIHNTLTALIKQYFLIKKVQLVKWQKQMNKDQQYVYIQQLKMNIQKQKAALPLKLQADLMKSIMRIKVISRVQQYQKIAFILDLQFQNLQLEEKLLIYEFQLNKFNLVKEQFARRIAAVKNTIKLYTDQGSFKRKKSCLTQVNQSSAGRQSLETDPDKKQSSQYSQQI